MADQEGGSPRSRKVSQTYYGSEKQVVKDGKKFKEIEVTGEKPSEPIDMKKQKKLQRKKSIDKEELNIPCRDLGKADYEGWLFKKAGGHGIVPLSWKKYWVVVKLGKIYCYKTSFNISADYLLNVHDYTVENSPEKKKPFALQLKPNEEDKKQVVFAGDSEEEINGWFDIISKILSGEELPNEEEKNVPDYEERKSFIAPKTREKLGREDGRKRPASSAFMVVAENSETTGMPAGFGARTSSTSQPRVRKMSGNTSPGSVLSVGSMFHPLEETPGNRNSDDVNLKDILYKEVTVETVVAAEEVNIPGEPIVEPEPVSSPAPEEKQPEKPVVVEEPAPSPAPSSEPVPVPIVVISDEPEAVEEKPTVIDEDIVELSVQDQPSDRKTINQLFKDLSTEEDAESVIRQLEKEAEEEVEVEAEPQPSPTVPEVKQEVSVSVSEEKPETSVLEEEQIAEIPKRDPVDEEIVAPTVKVDEPVDVESTEVQSPSAEPESEADVEVANQVVVEVANPETTITESESVSEVLEKPAEPSVEVASEQTESPSVEENVLEVSENASRPADLVLSGSDENRDSVASDACEEKSSLDLSPTLAETNIDLGDDLDIPSLDTSDSSLIDDITLELNTHKDQQPSGISTQPNGTVIAAV